MTSLGEAVVDIGADTTGFRQEVESGVNSALGKASKSMENIGKKMTSTGKKLSLLVTAPLIGVGVAAVKTQADFETSMNLLQANTDAPASAMQNLSTLAKQLGADTVFSAGEAADAMLELAKGGFKTAEIAGGGVQATMALAATEGINLADAATITSNAMNAFGLEAKDATQIADALAAGSAASSASVLSLSEGLGNVGASAKQSGLSLQETVTALSILDANAIKGAEGGTALRSFLTALTPTSQKAKNAIRELGLEFKNADGSFKSLGDISQQLRDKLGKMGEAQRAEALQTIFGTYAKQAAAVFLDEGAKGFDKYTTAVGKSGVAQKLADARMKGTAGAIEKMKGSVETALLAVGTAVAPVVVKVANAIGTLADKFTNLSPHMQQLAIIAAVVAAAIGPLLVVVGTLITAVGAIAGAFAGATLAAALPIVAIVALVAIFAVLLVKSKAVRKVVMDAFSQIKAAALPAIAQISAMMTGTLIPAFEKVWPIIQKVGLILLKVFAGAVVGAIKGALNVIVGVFRVITGIVQVFTGLLTGDFSKAWEGVKNIFGGALQAILGAVMVWLNVGLLGVFRRGLLLLKGLVTGAWAGVKALFTAGMAGVRSIMNTVLNVLTLPFRLAFSAMRAIASGAWAGIRGLFSAAMGGIRSLMGAALGAIRSSFGNAMRALAGLARSALSAVRSVVSSGISAVVGIIRGFPGRIRALAGAFLSAGKSLGGKVISGIMSGLRAAGGLVSDLAGSIKSAINGALHLPFTIHGPGPLPDFTIPAFAGGTPSFPGGGLAMVGERGRELVSLPGGSTVYTNHATERMVGDDGPVDLSDDTIRRLAAAILAGARSVAAGAVAANNRAQEDAVFN